MSDDSVSKLNVKEVSKRIVTDMFAHIFAQCRGKVADKIIEFAKSEGCVIPDDRVDAWKNGLEKLFVAPAAFPAIEITLATVETERTVSTSSKSGAKKKTTDRAPKAGLKAADFRILKVPKGMETPLCPAIMKSGDRDGKPCDKECKRVLPEHDEDDETCAQLECNHMYCGGHVVKAHGDGGEPASKRKNKNADPEDNPVVYEEEGGSTKVSANAVGRSEKKTQSAAGKKAINNLKARLAAKSAKKKEEKKDSDVEEPNEEESE